VKRLTLLLILVTLGLSACGEKKDVSSVPTGSAQPVTLMLDWVPNADHVGIYQGLAEGDFAKAAIDLHVQVPSDPATPLQLVAAGKVDAAISYEPEVMLARNRGLPLVSVAALVQKPLTSLISLASKHVSSAASLRGKTVGDAGISYQHAYLQTILAHAGVSPSRVKEVNVGANLVPAMLSGRVDATLGGYWNYEAIQLQQRGKRANVLRVNQLGVPSYDELVLVVTRKLISTKPDLVRRLIQAVARGYESARRDPQAAVQSLIRANPGLDQRLQLASTKETLPLFFPAAGKPWGFQDAAQWNAYGQWMLSNHLIHDPNAILNASTNELLAGQGP
jgi:putative hydroxymethylpyrimidine transport system substrate-binding protein